MEYKLFVDSDVVIDFFTDREPHANPASELFELNEQGDVKLYLSAVSINNISYPALFTNTWRLYTYIIDRKTVEVLKKHN